MRKPEYDCQACGACCINPKHNRSHNIIDYVQLFPADRLFQRRGLRDRWTVRNDEGEWHMTMTKTGRCTALAGTIGTHAGCGIYAQRPDVCRALEPGTEKCLTARREQGLPPGPR